MKQTPKFLMMLATAGLALSMAAHAEENPSQNYNQGTNAAVEGAKDLLGKTFNFGRSAFSALSNSEPVKQVKDAVFSTGSAVYNSEEAQKIKGVASDAYNSNPVQSIKTGAGNVISAGKDKVNDISRGVNDYKQNALATRGVTESSSEEDKKAAYGDANGEAVKSFFGNLLNKTKAVTQEVATTVQNATAPTDPIGEIAKSEKVQNVVVASPEEAMKNAQNLRIKHKPLTQKTKLQSN